MSKCAICGVIIHRSFFCKKCYDRFRDEIISKEPWTSFLVNEELKRRRQLKREPIFIYLSDKWDIDLDGNLVYRDGYHHG